MHLFLECATGVSGDMLLAALADLGGDLEPLQRALDASKMDISFRVAEEMRSGLRGRTLHVQQSGEQPLRNLEGLLSALGRLSLDEKVRERAASALRRLAEIEARVHGIAVDDVHFHEVGAADTLVDVAGVFYLLDQLEVAEVTCNTLPWFQGRVSSAHGELPLPAPATAELLKGKPVRPTEHAHELITPTGALLLDSMVDRFTNGPEGEIRNIGLGWGSHDLDGIPNLLRVFAFDPLHKIERVWVLETNVDHLTGEEIGGLFDPMFEAGALDVIYLPGLMKKNRPGGQLQVMCADNVVQKVQSVLFRQSLTLGLRRRLEERVVLPRQETRWSTPAGDLRAKRMELEGESYSRPEFASLKELARKTGRTVAELRYLLMEDRERLKDEN